MNICCIYESILTIWMHVAYMNLCWLYESILSMWIYVDYLNQYCLHEVMLTPASLKLSVPRRCYLWLRSASCMCIGVSCITVHAMEDILTYGACIYRRFPWLNCVCSAVRARVGLQSIEPIPLPCPPFGNCTIGFCQPSCIALLAQAYAPHGRYRHCSRMINIMHGLYNCGPHDLKAIIRY